MIDASGAAPGTIRLSARDDLTLAATAVLDVHGTTLQTDSYGVAVDASNTAHVELSAADGAVTLSPGATIDMTAPDGVARGQLIIDAPRLGGVGGDGGWRQRRGGQRQWAPEHRRGRQYCRQRLPHL